MLTLSSSADNFPSSKSSQECVFNTPACVDTLEETSRVIIRPIDWRTSCSIGILETQSGELECKLKYIFTRSLIGTSLVAWNVRIRGVPCCWASGCCFQDIVFITGRGWNRFESKKEGTLVDASSHHRLLVQVCDELCWNAVYKHSNRYPTGLRD